MTTKHTPGPWIAYPKTGGEILYYGIVVARALRGKLTGWEQDANARLIAAAPDLLAELKEWASDHTERYLKLIDRETLDDEDARWMQKYERTRAAIAKAEAGK
jgi:hypothetical protein